QTEVGNSLASELEKTEARFRQELEDCKVRLAELLNNPPWGASAPPTTAITSAKIQTYISEMARLYGKELPGAYSLDHVKAWVNERTTGLGDQTQLAALKARIEDGSKLLE